MKPSQKGVRLAILLSLIAGPCLQAAGPTVSNVRSAQRPGTQLVDIDYDLADADSPTLTVSVAVSTNGGASYALPATSFTGALGVSVTPGANKRITWNAGQDWPNQFSANVRFRVTADDAAAIGLTNLIHNLESKVFYGYIIRTLCPCSASSDFGPLMLVVNPGL